MLPPETCDGQFVKLHGGVGWDKTQGRALPAGAVAFSVKDGALPGIAAIRRTSVCRRFLRSSARPRDKVRYSNAVRTISALLLVAHACVEPLGIAESRCGVRDITVQFAGFEREAI
jgi:hypothetical protein